MIAPQPSFKLPVVDSFSNGPGDRRKQIERLEALLEEEKQKIRQWKYDPKASRSDKAGSSQVWQQEQLETFPHTLHTPSTAQQQQQQQQQTPQQQSVQQPPSNQPQIQVQGMIPRTQQPQVVLEPQISEERDVEMEDDDYDEEEDEEDDDNPSFGEDPQNLQTDIFY
eukprot:TRINITY_DN3900_c0_g1_i15.p4 TRINITY_DN3900_c0_g1~~TRINITY_DN3900_c0_g1_i15.p4  ORF type:complete len:167 (-),score=25.03 TRINITY_DN3900_c0_g1_i15:192-692(-)